MRILKNFASPISKIVQKRTSKSELKRLMGLFEPISKENISSLDSAFQSFADCYLISSISALARSTQGRKILQNNIHFAETPLISPGRFAVVDSYKILFNNVNNKRKRFIVGEKEVDRHLDIYCMQSNKILFAMKMAMQKVVNNNFFKKPILSRLISPFRKNFEYNKPSNFMFVFTGKKPIVVAESDFNLDLKKYKKQIIPLFKKMADNQNNDYSFVAGTGFKQFGQTKDWHCVVVESVDFSKSMVSVKDKRTNEITKMKFDDFLNQFKFVVGYFNENLK